MIVGNIEKLDFRICADDECVFNLLVQFILSYDGNIKVDR